MATEQGYTLIEMVIVLSLAAILLAIGALGVRSALAREEADGWVRSIVYDLAAGQQAAITRRANVIATFQNQGYTIARPNGGVLRQDTLPSHMTFGSSLQSVTFNRRGLPVGSGGTPLSSDWTMTVSSTSGRSLTITVAAGTGRVSYTEP